MNLVEVVHKAIPDLSEEQLDYLVRTRAAIRQPTAKAVYKAVDRWRRAQAHGIFLCELCDREAREDDWICARCDKALHTQMDDDK